MNPNEHLGAVQRAVLSTDFTAPGGLLTPKMQAAFFEYFRDFKTPFLAAARRHTMTQITEDIDKLYIAEPITEAASENSAASFDQEPLAGGTVRLTGVKTRSSWEMTNDVQHQVMEQSKLQAHIMDMMVRRFAMDLEMMAVQGDESISSTGAMPVEKVRRANNGWGVLTDSANIVDAGGDDLVYDHFHMALDKMPAHRLADPDLKWIWNPAVRRKLARYLSDRQDAVGTRALQGLIDGPLGIPYMEASSIPIDLTVTGLEDATPAVLRSRRQGPFVIDATHKNLKLDINSVGALTIDLSAGLNLGVSSGPLHARELAKVINDALAASSSPPYNVAAYKYVASADPDGFLVLTAPLTGASSTITVNPSSDPGNNADTRLGFLTTNTASGTSQTTTGGASNSGVRKTGSFIWLANPQNFIYGVLAGTVIYSRFLEDYDKNRFVMYNWSDFQVEELDYICKVKNLVV